MVRANGIHRKKDLYYDDFCVLNSIKFRKSVVDPRWRARLTRCYFGSYLRDATHLLHPPFHWAAILLIKFYSDRKRDRVSSQSVSKFHGTVLLDINNFKTTITIISTTHLIFHDSLNL